MPGQDYIMASVISGTLYSVWITGTILIIASFKCTQSMSTFPSSVSSEVTVVGSTMMDLVTYTDSLPKTGETVFGTSFATSFGGKGANQAVQCARLGIKSRMVGAVGKDSYGVQYLAQLANENVDTRGIKVSDKYSTGTASIQVDKNGQNSIIIVQGANLDLLPECLESMDSMIAQSNVVICQNEIPLVTTKRTLQLCQKYRSISILNPAPVSTEVTTDLLPLCDIICPNELELAALTNLPADTNEEIHYAAKSLLERSRSVGGCRIVIVTLGARGAYVITRDGNMEGTFYQTNNVEAVDTVGAGDSFIGTFASNVARNVPLEDAIVRSLHCASISVTRPGAQVSYPRLSDLSDTKYHPPSLPVDEMGESLILDKQLLRSSLGL